MKTRRRRASINEHFVAVKVDRDERPDVDARYQAAVSAISGQGGWPVTAFLTPEGRPYFGGTYFPPEDRHGRPSFQRVLLTMADAFLERRAEVDESAASVMNAIEHNEAFSGRASGAIEEIGPELVAKMVASTLKSADPRHGGFGAQPKFPHSSALDLLIGVASRTDEHAVAMVQMSGLGTVSVAEAARHAALLTLDKMAKGGIHDHLAGGFHRYSVDEHWVVPHFEKMAYDNSELLKNYLHAYQAFGEPELARVARGVMRWMDEWLSDRERGGFYASQDADFSLDDDGDYFTWTLDEAAEVLTAEELAVAAGYYEIGEIGDMHHNVRKNVLHVKRGMDAVARKAGVDVQEARTLLDSVMQKMLAARLARPTPYVDKTMYVAWNAMCISAYLEAGRVLDAAEARGFALKSLDRALATAWGGRENGLAHVMAYGEPGVTVERIAGVLDDYVFLGQAALDAWETTGEMRYYEAAEALMESALERFYDPVGGGFFDTQKTAEGERSLGVLAARRKPLQESPTPAGNPMAAMLLLRLHALNGRAGICSQGTGDDGGVCRRGGTLRPVRGDVYPGTTASDNTGGAGVRDRRRCRGARIGGGGAAAVCSEQERVVRMRPAQLGALPPELQKKLLPYLPNMTASCAVVCSGILSASGEDGEGAGGVAGAEYWQAELPVAGAGVA